MLSVFVKGKRRSLRAKPIKPAETEAGFQQAVVEHAMWHGWSVYHTWLAVRSREGFPDLVLVRGERLVFAELKSMRGKVSDAQAHWLGILEITAAEVFMWRPSDWPAIEKVLE